MFWNLKNTGGHPVDKDTKATVLLSGFSPSLLKFVLNGEAVKEEFLEVVQSDGILRVERLRITPEEILKRMLNDTLYDPVREILGETTEGTLKEFEFLGPSVEEEGKDDVFEMI